MDTTNSTPVTTAEDLAVVLDSPVQYRMHGPVLLAPAALREMEHVGVAATAIFNPFGPTVETFSLGCFHGEWDAGRPVLIRRSLHPFTEPYIQAITEVYMHSESWRDHVAVILATFIGGNGAGVASRDWAEPVLATVPSGVVITDVGAQWTPEIRRGLAWLLQNTDEELREETEKIHACGSDFWQQATWEMDQVRTLLGAGTGGTTDIDTRLASQMPRAPVFAVMTDDIRGIPDVATVDDLNDIRESPTFTAWWDQVAAVDYQRALHTQLPSAWHGAIGQVPGLMNLGNTAAGRNDDFDAWWRLFGVGERNC